VSLRSRPSVFLVPLGLAAGAVALAIVVTSNHDRNIALDGTLGLLLGWSFIGTGIVAWERRPENRTGALMVALGFVWFAGSLTSANDSLPFTIGHLVGALPLAVFIHLLCAFPNGRLESRLERVLVLSAYPTAVLASLTTLLVDSTPTDDCKRCPSNAFLVAEHHGVANALQVFWNSVGVVYFVVVGIVLIRRWRAATAPARRVLTPVYVGGIAAAALLSVGFFAQVSGGGTAVSTVGIIAFMSVPYLFLAGLLRTRLARTAAAQLLQETAETPTLEETQASLRRMLSDPGLRLLVREHEDVYVDAMGRTVDVPTESGDLAVTMLAWEGDPVAAVVHDPALLDEPELLDDVLAAARVALVKDRSVQALRASERRNRALLDAIPDNMFRIRSDGTYIDFHTNRPDALGMKPEAIVGSTIGDHVPEEVSAAEGIAAIRRVIETGVPETFEIELLDNSGRMSEREVRMVRSGDDEVLAITRDITDRKRAEQEIMRQQEELKRSRSRIVDAEANERRRLERNLHDGAQQRLVSLSLALRMLHSKIVNDPPGAQALLEKATTELALALEELRELARGIHPAILSDRGLRLALESLAARAPLPVEIDTVPEERLPKQVEAAAFYVISEALTNVAKYAQASVARVSVCRGDDQVQIEVVDDGLGGADATLGTGLSGLVDRVEALDGIFVVDSPLGAGTSIRATIPLPDGDAPDETQVAAPRSAGSP
jgi:PAS domain S-box-containing protein